MSVSESRVSRLSDLPESTLLSILTYLVDPSQLYTTSYHLLTTSHFFYNLLHIFIAHELQAHQLPGSLIKNATLRMYYSYCTPKIVIVGGLVENRRVDLYLPTGSRFKRLCGVSLKRSEEFDVVWYRGCIVCISGADEIAVGNIEVSLRTSSPQYMPPN